MTELLGEPVPLFNTPVSNNLCYINTVLQSLLSIPQLALYVQGSGEGGDREDETVVCVSEIIDRIKDFNSRTYAEHGLYVRIDNLKQHVWTLRVVNDNEVWSNPYNNSTQHDVEGFYDNLLWSLKRCHMFNFSFDPIMNGLRQRTMICSKCGGSDSNPPPAIYDHFIKIDPPFSSERFDEKINLTYHDVMEVDMKCEAEGSVCGRTIHKSSSQILQFPDYIVVNLNN